MDRRSFVTLLAAPFVLQSLRSSRKKNSDTLATSRFIFSQTVRRAKDERWTELAFGEMMVKVAALLVGTPYVGGTLEGDGPEVCRIDLTGLDCVTFFENALCMTRVIRKGRTTWDDLVREITYTRYRNGTLSGFTSRLHYTSDWIEDNVRKGVIRDVSKDCGGALFPVQLGFMSQNPRYYKPLAADTSLIRVMEGIERQLATTTRYVIGKENISAADACIATGDIVAISTSKNGLDYSHTGIAVRQDDGIHLMHASSQKKKVLIDVRLADYVASVRTNTGISVVRPLDVSR